MPPGDNSSETPQIFLSYASTDRARAEALYARLQSANLIVWFDRVRLRGGAEWFNEIEAACEASQIVVPLITPAWHRSAWTKFETYIHSQAVPLLPDGATRDALPPPLRRFQAHKLDPLAASEAQWNDLVADLRKELARPRTERARLFRLAQHERNPHFIGREGFLTTLHEALHPSPTATREHRRVWAIAGLGGMGKTSVANEYIRRFERLYRRIVWIDARADLPTQFAELHDLMGLGSGPHMPNEARARLALHALRSAGEEDRPLLVMDDVDDLRAALSWIPRDGACRTLLTTRRTDLPPTVQVLPLPELEPHSAAGYLRRRAGEAALPRDDADRTRLARRLGHLPLALEQAAAYINVHRISPGTYLEELSVAPQDLLSRHFTGHTDYPEPVLTTWHVTKQRLSAQAQAILRACALLGPAPVPLEMLQRGGRLLTHLAASQPRAPNPKPFLWRLRSGDRAPPPPSLPDGETAARLVRTAVAEQLAAYSMIQDWNEASFRVHPLVAEVEFLSMEPAARVQTGELAARLLTPMVPETVVDAESARALRPIIEHAGALAERLEALESIWPDHLLPAHCRAHAVAQGQVRLARVLAMAEYQTARRRLGPVHADTMTASEVVAKALLDNGEYRLALPLYHAIREAKQTQLGPEHADTPRSMNDLARCMRLAGDPKSALPLFQQALEIQERVLGIDHPDTLNSVNSVAVAFEALGESAAALPLFHRALEGRERVLGLEDPDTLQSLHNLACCLMNGGDSAAALPLHRRALAHRERVLGVEHPATLFSVSLLARCLENLGDAAAALPLHRHALETRERVLHAEHPDTLTSMSNLASCLISVGDAVNALPIHRFALAALEQVLGSEHPETLQSMTDLAWCLREMDDIAAALPLCRQALSASERVLGIDHPLTLLRLNNMALCLQDLGDDAKALDLHRRALEGRQRVLGPDHPATLQSMDNLGLCMQAMGDAAGALPCYRQALEGRERVLGSEHPDTLFSLSNLAHGLLALGDADALTLNRRALEARERVHGVDHPLTLLSVGNLAHCLSAAGDSAAALPLNRRALEGRERVLGADHRFTLQSANNLGYCLLALGDAAAALPFFRRAADAASRKLGSDHPLTRQFAANLADCEHKLTSADAVPTNLSKEHWGYSTRSSSMLGADHPWTTQFAASILSPAPSPTAAVHPRSAGSTQQVWGYSVRASSTPEEQNG